MATTAVRSAAPKPAGWPRPRAAPVGHFQPCRHSRGVFPVGPGSLATPGSSARRLPLRQWPVPDPLVELSDEGRILEPPPANEAPRSSAPGTEAQSGIERRPPEPIQPSQKYKKIPYSLRNSKVRRGPKRSENGWQNPKRLAERLAEIGSLRVTQPESVLFDRIEPIEPLGKFRQPARLRARTGSHLVRTRYALPAAGDRPGG